MTICLIQHNIGIDEDKMEVELYETVDGKCPVADFLKNLDPKLYAKTLHTIDLLEINGINLREPYTKKLTNGIFELRIKHGSNNNRVLFFFYTNDKAIMTNGFIKKTRKTPLSEIRRAKKYKADYERRQGNEI